MWTSLNPNNEQSILKMINTSYKNLVIALNDYDDKLAISFCGEPRDYTDNLVDLEDIEVLNNVNKAFVKMVRSTGGNNSTRKLVITTGWSKCDGLPAKKFKMVDDQYTIVRIHLYKPGSFSGSKTSLSSFSKPKPIFEYLISLEDLGDITPTNQRMLVEKATHTFDNCDHYMDLTLIGADTFYD